MILRHMGDSFASDHLTREFLLTGLSEVTSRFGVKFHHEDGNAKAGGGNRKRRTYEERGLPSDETIRDMARMYLNLQHQHWSRLVQSGDLPALETDVIERMVAEFKEVFLGEVSLEEASDLRRSSSMTLGSCYLRFSCDKSNPRSLVQQLKKALESAADESVFVPWSFVFADAGVSGTTNDRHGYDLVYDALTSEDLGIEFLFIDEIGRASRDAVEALSLGKSLEAQGKILLGASDGFDSRVPNYKLLLMTYAMLQEWFIDQLKAKVARGMDDAFDRGTNLRPPSFGYHLVPAVDGNGNRMIGRDGESLNMLAIKEDDAEIVREIYRRFLYENRNRTVIARWLNELGIGNRKWDSSRVTQLLRRHKHAGINVENMTKVIAVLKNGKLKRAAKKRPRSEWKVKRAKHLQLVSYRDWKETQRKLDEMHEVFSAQGRGNNQRSDYHHTVLVRPVCGACGKRMWLGRSGKYASFTCLDGRDGKNGCTHNAYKSVRLVEDSILSVVVDQILSPERILELVEKANVYLIAEASKPSVDTSKWKREIKQLSQKCDRLIKILEEEGTSDLQTLVVQQKRHERRIAELTQQVRHAERSKKACRPVELADVVELVSDVRDVLQQDVAVAAPLLREITGPVVVHLQHEKGKKRPTWIAEFKDNIVPVLAKAGKNGDCPTTGTWEFLNTAGWKFSSDRQVPLEAVPQYRKIQPEVLRLQSQGHSRPAIAAIIGVNVETVNNAINDAEGKGVREWAKKDRSKVAPKEKRRTYKDISVEVARLRDTEGETFDQIAEILQCSVGMVYRAYTFAHPELVSEAAKSDVPIQRARNSRLSKETKEQMREMIRGGYSNSEITHELSCSWQTVARMRKAMEK